MRRIRFTLNFRMPSLELRIQLWQKAFPENLYLEDIDYEYLSKWEFSGATIKSIALNSIFMAEAYNAPISTPLVRVAIKRELHRMGRLDLED